MSDAAAALPGLTDRLRHWADTAPERTFMAQRQPTLDAQGMTVLGDWRHVSYREAWDTARRIAQSLITRGLSAERPVVILDWQGLGYGLGTIDVAYWLGTSMATEERRSHERALVDHYHDALIGHGVRDYSRERCWNDYRRNAIHGLQIGVFGLGAVKRSPRGDRMWQNWIARTAAQVRDLDSYAELAATT